MKSVKSEEKKSEHWLKKIFCNILGTLLIVMPILIIASVFDYHAGDPSFNKVTSETPEIQNFLGSFGAFFADFVLSSFGLALIIFLLIPILWGVCLLKQHEVVEWKMRLFAWFVGLIGFACFIDLTCRNYLGGLNLPYNLTGGWTRHFSGSLNSYANYLTMLKPPYNKLVLLILLLFISTMAFNFAAGITFRFWLGLSAGITEFFRRLFRFGWKGIKKVIRIPSFNEFKEINPNYMRAKIQSKINNLNVRREPEFERIEPVMNNRTLATSTALSSPAPTISQPLAATEGPKIVIPPVSKPQPEKAPTPAETPKKTSEEHTSELQSPTHISYAVAGGYLSKRRCQTDFPESCYPKIRCNARRPVKHTYHRPDSAKYRAARTAYYCADGGQSYCSAGRKHTGGKTADG